METLTPEIIAQERARDERGHRLYHAERRRELIAAYRKSGLTQLAFARREGVKYSTFTAWLQGRRGADRGSAKRPLAATAAPVGFAELKLPEFFGGGRGLATPERRGGNLEVRLPDGTAVLGPTPREVAALVRRLRRS